MGDTVGYTADQVGTGERKKKFASDWSDYKFGVYPNFSKYTTDGESLELEDDAAHVNMGGEWHMPSPDQIEELINNTTNTWTKQDGVNGMTFTSKKDTSKSIFIPAASNASDDSLYDVGSSGGIWSSMLSWTYYDINYGHGQGFGFDSADGWYLYDDYRYRGYSVRDVIG